MLRIRVMPCLLLQDQKLVKTIKFKDSKYIGDPINAVRIFNEKEVDELIFLDISATIKKKKPSFNLLSKIASECFMPLCYGGGIRNLEDIKKILSLGVEKVSINSYAVEDPIFIKQAAKIFGSQSIVVSIDVKINKSGEYKIFTHSGQKGANISPELFAVKMEQMGAGEILLNSIDRDGTMEGYDADLIRRVVKAVNIPVIACGGACGLEDFARAIKEAGASAVAAGSLFVFYGKNRSVLINYPATEELEKIFN